MFSFWPLLNVDSYQVKIGLIIKIRNTILRVLAVSFILKKANFVFYFWNNTLNSVYEIYQESGIWIRVYNPSCVSIWIVPFISSTLFWRFFNPLPKKISLWMPTPLSFTSISKSFLSSATILTVILLAFECFKALLKISLKLKKGQQKTNDKF